MAVAHAVDAEYQIQAFETNLLEVPVGKLWIRDGAGSSLGDRLDKLTAAWRNDGVWLVSCRVPENAVAIPVLETAGFEAVETMVTFRQPPRDRPMPAGVEAARPGDHDACVAIAGEAFAHDRMHRDPRVPDAVADLIRETWVRNDLAGRADASLVVRADGAVVGFNLCLLDGDEAVIDLIAVAAKHRAKGLGRQLVEGALAYYGGRAATMRVGTQANNEESVELYERTGFVEASRQITLHWINPEAAPTLAENSR